MLLINIILVIFAGLIINHFVVSLANKGIEGLDNKDNAIDSDEYIPPPKDTTEYTAAEVAAQLELIKKRESKYQIQMKELSALKKQMDENSEAIVALQEAVVEAEAETINASEQ